MRSILLQLHIDSPVYCNAWANVPTAHGVQIAVYVHSGASLQAVQCARQCFAMLERSFVTLGGVINQAPCFRDNGRIFPAHTCAGAVHGLHQRVLIYISDGTGQIDPDFEQYFSTSNSTVIPIVDTSFGSQVSGLIPLSFNAQIAEFISGFDINPVIPRIINYAGIKSNGFRLFISYRHEDAALIAGQLFHALSARRFDPFLDRFSSRTGDDFVTLIREELYDKACVLVLETDQISDSQYCQQEVATATANYLGLMAVDLPGSMSFFSTIGCRFDLSDSFLDAVGMLAQNDIEALVNFIEQNYNDQISRRWIAQDRILLDSIIAANLNPQAMGIGQYSVNNGQQNYLLSMCRCPPSIDDFIQTEQLAQQAPGSDGVLFGPISVVRSVRAQQIAWLSGKSAIRAIDEGHILRSIQDIAINQLL